MFITILGRQPALGMAELERLYGADSVRWFSDNSALVTSPDFDFEQLGGTQKAGQIVAELRGDWRHASTKIVAAYSDAWRGRGGKITLGISAYGFDALPRDIQKTGLILKKKLRDSGISLRLIPNAEPALNTASSHHNKLGLSDNKVELLVVRAKNGNIIIAESIGAQNVTALAARDQGRPKTDAFVGMLPPKLARMMVNLASGTRGTRHISFSEEKDSAVNARDTLTLLDPFCGTGTLLQEAALLGYRAYGTDLSEKMVDFTQVNLEWLAHRRHAPIEFLVEHGDAMTHRWQQPIDLVACETYLGQPFSAPPSTPKLTEVRDTCNRIISAFLANIHGQVAPGTQFCVAVPAWRSADGTFTHLPLVHGLEKLGFRRHALSHVRDEQLLYYREGQAVARELLLFQKP